MRTRMPHSGSPNTLYLILNGMWESNATTFSMSVDCVGIISLHLPLLDLINSHAPPPLRTCCQARHRAHLMASVELTGLLPPGATRGAGGPLSAEVEAELERLQRIYMPDAPHPGGFPPPRGSLHPLPPTVAAFVTVKGEMAAPYADALAAGDRAPPQ